MAEQEIHKLEPTNEQKEEYLRLKAEKDAKVDRIVLAAGVAHEVNRAYCSHLGDDSQKSWDNCEDWQRESAIQGVVAIDENRSITPAQLHSSWLAQKKADGWIYGDVKDALKKTHPCMVPYNMLAEEQQLKDTLFGAAVRAVMGIPQ